MEEEVPTGLHALQYARHLCEEVLAWPAKSNLELLADCITSVSKAKKLSLDRAYKYLVRAVKLHKEQGGEIDAHWFRNGAYTNVRPKFDRTPQYKPMTAEEKRRLAEDQASPAYQELVREMDDLLRKLSGQTKMEAK